MPADVFALLAALQNPDGGFPPAPNGASEPEPTALAAIALDDDAARVWLAGAQRADGGFIMGPEAVRNDCETPLAALALPAGDRRERALDYVVEHQAPKVGADDRVPHDTSTRGWGWTSKTFGWVEPTARSLLALKLLRPDAQVIADGNAVMADRECSVGGWNYGNREVMGKLYEPFLETTAAGLLGVQDLTTGIRERALDVIGRLWRLEPGGLGWAMTSVALRAVGQPSAELDRDLDTLLTETGLYGDTVALAWMAIARGPSIASVTIR
jgi:hypothetical protein